MSLFRCVAFSGIDIWRVQDGGLAECWVERGVGGVSHADGRSLISRPHPSVHRRRHADDRGAQRNQKRFDPITGTTALSALSALSFSFALSRSTLVAAHRHGSADASHSSGAMTRPT